VSEGETIEVVVDDYLERHDPERKALRLAEKDKARPPEGVRPEGPRGETPAPRSRHIPAAEQREVLRAQGDRCCVEGCPNRGFLEFAHRWPFALGGANVARNLHRLCHMHHTQMDAGIWKPVRGAGGSVVLVDRQGRVMGKFREPALAPGVNVSGKPPP
jgi:hypothetical protein